ncbi:MAG: AMP-binding protein [Bacillota bacterium]|nr:AMP-binding protein [Bacillota bacterium]
MIKITENLRSTLKYAYENFKPVREKYIENNIDLNNVNYLEELPLISKEDLNKYEFYEMLAVKAETVSRIFTTTGTSGRMSMIGLTKQDWKNHVESLKQSLIRLGACKEDIYYDMIPRTTMFAAYVGYTAWEDIGAAVITAGLLPVETHIKLIANFKPTVLFGIASFILSLSEKLSKQDKNRVNKIIVVGEVLDEFTRNKLESAYGCQVYSGYGISEVMTANECKEKNGFHVKSNEIITEVIDKDEKGYGELVYTCIGREAMPLIRFRSGDYGRVIEEKCPCGCEDYRIQVFGRKDSMVNIKGKLVDINYLKSLIIKEKGIISAKAFYIKGEKTEFIIKYDGNIDESKLARNIKIELGVTPKLQKECINYCQWKDKFFQVINDNNY